MATTRKTTPAGRKSRTGTTRKSTRTPAAKSAPPAAQAAEARAHLKAVAPATPAPAPDAAEDKVADPRFKRPDLIEAVSERTALKRSDAKVVLELVLDELGKALDANEELVLPPLGKLMVKKRKPDSDGPDILTIKVRRPRDAGEEDSDRPLADRGEDS